MGGLRSKILRGKKEKEKLQAEVVKERKLLKNAVLRAQTLASNNGNLYSQFKHQTQTI